MKDMTGVNLPLLDKVAKWLEAGAPHTVIYDDVVVAGFDMDVGIASNVNEDNFDQYGDWNGGEAPGCGTTCCIAGAVIQFGSVPVQVNAGKEYPWYGVLEGAIMALNIEPLDAERLFKPERMGRYSDPVKVAVVLRHFMVTGEVDWKLYGAGLAA
jgi:hypothetical protein